MENTGIIKIRMNTFETNSSSSHTCILHSDDEFVSDKEINLCWEEYKMNYKDKQKDLENIYIDIKNSYFGSNFNLIDNWKNKLEYLLSNTIDEAIDEDISSTLEDILKLFKRLFPEFKGFNFISETNSNEFLVYDSDISFIDNICMSSYFSDNLIPETDHYLLEDIKTALRKISKYKNLTDEEILKEIIFNDNIVIITDTDGLWTLNNSISTGALDIEKLGKRLWSYDSRAEFKSFSSILGERSL